MNPDTAHMIYWILNDIFAFALCVLFAGIFIPQILLIAFRRNLFDEPDERKIHTSKVPRLGGIAFIPSIFFCMSLLLGFALQIDPHAFVVYASSEFSTVAFCFCALLLLWVLGMADDLIGVRYRAKFVIQILCAVLIISGGLWINALHGVFGVDTMSPWAGWPLTVLVTVFIINSVNLIDGIDGLASGLSSAALLIYGLILLQLGDYLYSMFAFAALGVLVPFFYYNVFGDSNKQKKIFMGDTGSLTIGMVLTILAIRLIRIPADFDKMNMIVVACSPLIIPCFDVIRVYLGRIHHHRNPFLPDKSHIHHKFLAAGMSQRRSLCMIVGVSIIFTVCNIVLSRIINVNILLVLDLLAWLAIIAMVNKLIRNRIADREQAKSATPDQG